MGGGLIRFFRGNSRATSSFSALSSLLFAIVIDCATEEVRGKAPWEILFADDGELSTEEPRQAEERLEAWRAALKNRGIRLSRSKTVYMRTGGGDKVEGSIAIEDIEIPE